MNVIAIKNFHYNSASIIFTNSLIIAASQKAWMCNLKEFSNIMSSENLFEIARNQLSYHYSLITYYITWLRKLKQNLKKWYKIGLLSAKSQGSNFSQNSYRQQYSYYTDLWVAVTLFSCFPGPGKVTIVSLCSCRLSAVSVSVDDVVELW